MMIYRHLERKRGMLLSQKTAERVVKFFSLPGSFQSLG